MRPITELVENLLRPDQAMNNLQPISQVTAQRAAAAKARLEHFYEKAVSECKDRDIRCKELEARLAKESWSEEKKQRQLAALGRKESDFLRLRRTRLSVEDFITIKVIGKGAFGEVGYP
jgi:protein-serine/threonine kinase